MHRLIGDARRRLDEALAVTFAEDRIRFDRLVPGSASLSGLAAELRAVMGSLESPSPGSGVEAADRSALDRP
jgi:hypothetical protein